MSRSESQSNTVRGRGLFSVRQELEKIPFLIHPLTRPRRPQPYIYRLFFVCRNVAVEVDDQHTF